MRPRLSHALLTLVAAAAVTIPTVARAADDPPLLPLNVFFAHPAASWDHRVSPDGTRLAWIAMSNGRATLHFRRLDETSARAVEMPREARALAGRPSLRMEPRRQASAVPDGRQRR